MAIQSATALNPYLTADPSGQFSAGTSASAADGEVTPGQVEATPESTPEASPVAASDQAPAEEAPPSIGTAVPATYARNARPVPARAQVPSISLLA